jgi:Ca-activated chloride channel family protein
VVPGDQAAGRIPDPTVRTEVVYQDAQEAKRLASEALQRGDRDAAKHLLGEAVAHLMAAPYVPEALRGDFESEISEMSDLGERVDHVSTDLTSKLTRASYHDKNRKRGRRNG